MIGLGCWQLGGDWGEVGDDTAHAVLEAAVASGVTFLDTADVYGDGRSERTIGAFLASRPDLAGSVTVATKMGRRADPHVAEAYTYDAFCRWTDRSRVHLRTDTLDLVQLHCPPSAVLRSDDVYDALDRVVEVAPVHAQVATAPHVTGQADAVVPVHPAADAAPSAPRRRGLRRRR